MSPLRVRTVAAAGALLLSLLAGCSSGATQPAEAGQSAGGNAAASGAPAAEVTYPLSFKHDLGTAEIPAQPKKIVSTSVVLTGALLALDAPVVGSGAAQGGTPGFDDKGFFAHWSKVADERGVKALYDKSELDLEAVTAAAPDLIVMSTSGGDSTKDQYAQLSQIAPTVSVNYLTDTWQDIEKKLGEATGLKGKAEQLIKDYETQVADLKAKTAAPSEPVQAIVFQGENGAAFMLPTSAQGAVLKDMGFTLEPTDESKAQPVEGGKRNDVAFFSPENAIASLKSTTLLLVDGDASTVEKLRKTAGYAKTPPVASGGKIVPLGSSSFKIDYYSAIEMAGTLQKAFPRS